MFRLASFSACILALLFIATGAFAQGPWIMEWYALDAIKGTGGHANGFAVDWLFDIFGVPEGEIAQRAQDPNIVGESVVEGEEGSVEYSGGTYTVMAGGADIWGTADAFRYTYKEMSGDFEIALKAESIEQTNDWAKIGPMVRQDNSPGSQYLFMLARALDGNKYFQERMEAGGSATGNGGEVADAAGFPIWLKITRTGDDFTGAISDDGAAWTDVGTTTLALTDPVLVGLAVTSHSSGNITTAVATDLTIDGAEPAFADMTSEDIGIQFTETLQYRWAVRNLENVDDSSNLTHGIYGAPDEDWSNFVFYGFVGVISPVAQDTVINVAQDDEAKIWVNGELIGESTSWTGGATVTNPFPVSLKAGMNGLFIKVAEEGGGDYLNARFDATNLDFTPKDGQFDWATSVSPQDKLASTWGGIKSSR